MWFQRILFAKTLWRKRDCNYRHYVRNILMEGSNLSQASGRSERLERTAGTATWVASKQLFVTSLGNHKVSALTKYLKGQKRSKLHPRMIFAMITRYPHKTRRTCPEPQSLRIPIYSAGFFWCLPSTQIFAIARTICCDYFIVFC